MTFSNPHIERFMRTAKEECLGRMIFFGESSLQAAVVGFLAHHEERNHQGLGNKPIAAGEEVASAAGEVACCERFGGMLRYYYYLKAA
jgi:putative transposase